MRKKGAGAADVASNVLAALAEKFENGRKHFGATFTIMS